jgi:NH3-dependent NAD+ synthetase
MFYDNQIYKKGVKKRNARVVVVGISDGIDSAVAVSLATKAIGLEKVFGLILPDSSVCVYH